MSEYFYLPKGQFNSNDKELKKLQKNLLMNHYILASKNQKYNPQHHQQLPPPNNYNNMDGMFRQQLSQQYDQQIARKEYNKLIEKQNKIKQHQQIIKQNNIIQQQQYNKINEANKLYRQQFMNDYKRKQQIKKQQKQQQILQKQYFRRRYSQDNLGIAKLKSFQQHYQKLNQVRDKIEKDYIQNITPIQQKQQLKKNFILEKETQQQQSKIRQALFRNHQLAVKTRENLRDGLLQQIQEKRQQKMYQTRINKQQNYRSESYKNIHHPINNPVDFKITHDNPYILKQLHEKGGQKISGLAKSGQYALNS